MIYLSKGGPVPIRTICGSAPVNVMIDTFYLLFAPFIHVWSKSHAKKERTLRKIWFINFMHYAAILAYYIVKFISKTNPVCLHVYPSVMTQ